MAASNFNPRDMGQWYFGPIPRVPTQDLLQGKMHGTFLVRDSSSCPGDFVLSVSENSKVSHYIINRLQKGFRIGDQDFDDLPALIEFYKIHYLDTTTLIVPAQRPAGGPPEPQAQALAPAHTPSVMEERVRALYDFDGNDPEDLPFKKNEILVVVRKDEDQWWTVRNKDGREGSIPVPYVQVLPPGPTTTGAAPSHPQQPHSPPGYHDPQAAGIRSESGSSSTASATSASTPHPLPNPQNGPVYARVIQQKIPSPYDTTALTLEVGDIIRVTKINASGQWEGELKGKTGHFPFNHVKIIDPSNPEENDSSWS
uniref:CRK-CRKL-like protein ancestral isoform 2 n=1 Tax=Branchiostoma floridae TaxID=7739 RepID=A0A1C9VNQ7_BRAFL|nr:CRK-CRKL-like protein ancestral isoform 2 [Branchiostoma floridae]